MGSLRPNRLPADLRSLVAVASVASANSSGVTRGVIWSPAS